MTSALPEGISLPLCEQALESRLGSEGRRLVKPTALARSLGSAHPQRGVRGGQHQDCAQVWGTGKAFARPEPALGQRAEGLGVSSGESIGLAGRILGMGILVSAVYCDAHKPDALL